MQACWAAIAAAIVSLEAGILNGARTASEVPVFRSIDDYWVRAWEEGIACAFIILPIAVAAAVAAVYHGARSGWKGSTRHLVVYAGVAGPPVLLFAICFAIVQARACTIGMGTPPWLHARLYDVGGSPLTLVIMVGLAIYLTRRRLARG